MDKAKKIFLDCTFLRNTHTGIDVAFLSLIKYLLAADTKSYYTILLDSRYDKGYLMQQIEGVQNVAIKRIYSPLPVQVILAAFLIPFYLRFKRFDVYHNPYFFGPLLRFISPKTKVVITVHDLYHHTIPHNRRMIINIIFKTFADQAIVKADTIIAISTQTKDDIVRYLKVDSNRISIIPQALSEKLSDNRAVGSSVSGYGLVRKEYILTVGSLVPNKAFIDLLKAFEIFRNRFGVTKLKLVSVGAQQGDYADKVKGLIKSIGYTDEEVLLLGYVNDEDLKRLYAEAFIFVLPSYYEGFGLPLLEAMNFRLPVIARNSSSLKEVVGSAGLLFDDVEDLAIKLHQLSDDQGLYDRLVEKGLLRLKDFSWESSADKTLSVY